MADDVDTEGRRGCGSSVRRAEFDDDLVAGDGEDQNSPVPKGPRPV